MGVSANFQIPPGLGDMGIDRRVCKRSIYINKMTQTALTSKSGSSLSKSVLARARDSPDGSNGADDRRGGYEDRYVGYDVVDFGACAYTQLIQRRKTLCEAYYDQGDGSDEQWKNFLTGDIQDSHDDTHDNQR